MVFAIILPFINGHYGVDPGFLERELIYVLRCGVQFDNFL